MSIAISVTRCLTALGALVAIPVFAAETKVAVAANFTGPAKEIAAGFQKATGHKAALAFGSSGAFVTQISHVTGLYLLGGNPYSACSPHAYVVP